MTCVSFVSLFFVVLWQISEETTGQKSEFPQAGGVHDRPDDR